MLIAAMNRVQQVPFVKLNVGDTANASSPALPAALTWLWQQLAPPDLRAQFPVRASARGLISSIDVPPVKVHYSGPCVPVVRPGHVVPRAVNPHSVRRGRREVHGRRRDRRL